jgi:non-canonical purine NTP pyrophosphatase (RdgB/HAM1 family)
MIYFITGNKGKFAEIKAIIPEIEQLDLDLLEIQEIDPRPVIEEKLHEARKMHNGEFIVEDTSLYIDSMNSLPGPLIKWFLKSVGQEGVAKMAETFGTKAKAVTMIGYSDADGNIQYFEGSIDGEIVHPRGENGFGWDQIFQPKGYQKTFGEMKPEEKN